MQLGVGLLKQPLLVSLVVRAQPAPSGPPLPGSVSGASPHAGVNLPGAGHPLLDELPVYPTVLQNHPGHRQVKHRVGAGYYPQKQASVFLRPSHHGGLAGQDENQLLAAGHHPTGKEDGFTWRRHTSFPSNS